MGAQVFGREIGKGAAGIQDRAKAVSSGGVDHEIRLDAAAAGDRAGLYRCETRSAGWVRGGGGQIEAGGVRGFWMERPLGV